MDVLKCFFEEPAPLYAAGATPDPRAPDPRAPDPRASDPRAASGPARPGTRALPDTDGLDAFLAPSRQPFYTRLYLAGTHLPDDAAPARPRVGLTALRDARLFTAPLLALAAGRTWTAAYAAAETGSAEGASAPGAGAGLTAAEAAGALTRPGGVAALAFAPGAGLGPGALAAAAAPDRRRALGALCGLLDAYPDAVVLLPEPAHDGFDWSVFAARPLREPFADALRAHPAPHARRFMLPYARARGEHTFYFEQWQLDALPPHVEAF